MNKTNRNYEDNTDSYPKVLIPQFIKDIKNQSFTLNEIYPNYKIPQSPSFSKEKEDSYLYLKSFLGCGFFAFLGIGIFMNIIFNAIFKVSESVRENIISPIMIGVPILMAIIGVVLIDREKKIKEKKNKIVFNEKLNKYLKEKEKYKDLIDSISTPKFLSQERKKRLQIKLESFKKDFLKYAQILDDNEIKKGPSEEFFYQILKRYTDFEVYKSLKYGYYYPDLVLIKNNLLFDIEIDEPYSFDTKEPIHFDNIDEKRDNYFLNDHFVVIHFSEEQILKDPLVCVDIISEITNALLSLKDVPKSEKMLNFEQPIWTYEMAFNSAYNNDRQDVQKKIIKLKREYF